MLVVSDLHARGTIVREYVASFLLTIRRRDTQFNIGAAVNDRGEVVILPPPNGEPLPLSMHEATELQMKIRAAVTEASRRRQF